MITLIWVAIVLAVIWAVVHFVRQPFRATIKEETPPGGHSDGSNPSKVPAPRKPRPVVGAAAIALEEPDDES